MPGAVWKELGGQGIPPPHPSAQQEQKGSCGQGGELCLGTEQARTHGDTSEGSKLHCPKGRPGWESHLGLTHVLVMQVKEQRQQAVLHLLLHHLLCGALRKPHHDLKETDGELPHSVPLLGEEGRA